MRSLLIDGLLGRSNVREQLTKLLSQRLKVEGYFLYRIAISMIEIYTDTNFTFNLSVARNCNAK